MNVLEADAWTGFVGVVQNFLGNKKADNFVNIVQSMLDAYRRLGTNMSIKVYFCITISIAFLKTVVMLAMSKVNGSTKI